MTAIRLLLVILIAPLIVIAMALAIAMTGMLDLIDCIRNRKGQS